MLVPHPVGIPLPAPSLMTQPFWDACARGELIYQTCHDCGRANFDPQPVCRHCRSEALSWKASDGTGSVFSWSVVWRPQSPQFVAPYAPAIVRLDEGYDMVSTIISCEPTDIAAGMRVTVQFHPIGDGISLPYFAPTTLPHRPRD